MFEFFAQYALLTFFLGVVLMAAALILGCCVIPRRNRQLDERDKREELYGEAVAIGAESWARSEAQREQTLEQLRNTHRAYKGMRSERDRLRRELTEARADITELKARNAELSNAVDELENENLELGRILDKVVAANNPEFMEIMLGGAAS